MSTQALSTRTKGAEVRNGGVFREDGKWSEFHPHPQGKNVQFFALSFVKILSKF